jgi:hypothetical protein
MLFQSFDLHFSHSLPPAHRACLHCKRIGHLLGHGFLRGYGGSQEREVRGRRLYCSRRGRHTGCGKTQSIWDSAVIPRVSLPASLLWRFLDLWQQGLSRWKAYRQAFGKAERSRPYQICKQFKRAQSALRDRLLRKGSSPPLGDTAIPEIQTIRHILTAFADSQCPIQAFQEHFQTAFL